MCLRIYKTLSWLILPIVLLRLLIRGIKQRSYLYHWDERLAININYEKADLWIHAVSLGESKVAITLAEKLLNQASDKTVFFSCTTPTARTLLSAWVQGKKGMQVGYIPFDCLPFQKRLLNIISPHAVVCIETEIWPNMLGECERRNIPYLIANARLSKRSSYTQKHFIKIFRPLYQSAHLLIQDKNSQRRFSKLAGVQNNGSMSICGNSKLDIELTPNNDFQQYIVEKTQCGIGGRIVFGSIRRDESKGLLEASKEFLSLHNQHKIIWVPRHPEKDQQYLTKLFNASGLPWGRLEDALPQTKIILVGGYGCLIDCYAVADLVVLGGSFGEGGSHNPIEPGSFGKAIVAGPSRHNFSHIHRLLAKERAIVHLKSVKQLVASMEDLIEQKEKRKKLGERIQKTLAVNKGSATLQANKVLEQLEGRRIN